jgi:hypothetical protein
VHQGAIAAAPAEPGAVSRAIWVGLAAVAVSLSLLAVAMGVSLVPVLAGLVVLALAAAAYARPWTGAYVLIVLTPLLAGLERGSVIPFLRPYEAIIVVVGAALALRGFVALVTDGVRRPGFLAVDAAIVAMAMTSSVVPLLTMLARGQEITGEDLQFAAQLWKYYGVYLIFRLSIRTEDQVRRCLWLAMGAASIVSLLAIPQSLDVAGVPALLARIYGSGTSGVTVQSLSNFRGSSTLGTSFAVADVLTFNLAVALGFLSQRSTHRKLLGSMAALFMLGVVASGQFSGIIGLLAAIGTLALLNPRIRRLLLAFLPVALVAALALKPVIEQRLVGFSSVAGVPPSWLVRLINLRTYFLPKVVTDFNWVLGVRPAARAQSAEAGVVWIESGYVWILWTGGLLFMGAFLTFLWISLRATARLARRRSDAVGAAATGSFASLVVLAVLMTFDPHRTMRGAADLLFALLALACTVRHDPAGGR